LICFPELPCTTAVSSGISTRLHSSPSPFPPLSLSPSSPFLLTFLLPPPPPPPPSSSPSLSFLLPFLSLFFSLFVHLSFRLLPPLPLSPPPLTLPPLPSPPSTPPTTQALEELESWGLQLDTRMVDLQGRKLPPEKILFRKNTILANEEADWGRDAVKENVISAVSNCVHCILSY